MRKYADPDDSHDQNEKKGEDWSDLCLEDQLGPDSNQSRRAKQHPTIETGENSSANPRAEASDDMSDSLKGGSKHSTTGGAMNQYSGPGSHADCAAAENFGTEAAPLQYEDNEPHPTPPAADSPDLGTSSDSRWDDSYNEGYGLGETMMQGGASWGKDPSDVKGY
jgi:hypothetical protein